MLIMKRIDIAYNNHIPKLTEPQNGIWGDVVVGLTYIDIFLLFTKNTLYHKTRAIRRGGVMIYDFPTIQPL